MNIKQTAMPCGCASKRRKRSHPFRFEVRGRRFSSYTVMLYVGLVVALVVGGAVAGRTGHDARRVVLAILLLIPVALAGSRALAVLLAWRDLRGRRADILRMDRGGAAMYGGLPPALLSSWPLLAWLGIPFGAFWDLTAVAILAGMIPTRLGCLTNGCCAGRRTSGPFGLRLPDVHGTWERRFPSPLAEAALAAALLLLLRASWGALPFPGAALLLALGGYATGRFGLDWLRERRSAVFFGLGAYQWISLGLVAACGLGLLLGAPAAGAAVESVKGASVAGVGWADAAALVASGLVLLPVMVLFRFLGCDLVFKLKDPTPRFSVQLAAIVPAAAPQDTYTATIALRREEDDFAEIQGSPFALPPKAPLPDGSHVFEDLFDVPEGNYLANCEVVSTAVASRTGMCSGELNGVGLAVIFFAGGLQLPNEIVPVSCFTPPP